MLPQEFEKEFRTLRVELLELLPVPNAEVPIPDVLEFKERRKDELRELHKCLDELYLDAMSSPDEGLSWRAAMANLKAAIAALDTLSTEKWQRTRKYDFSTELNLDGGKVTSGIAAGAAFDFYTSGVTFPLGAAMGAALSLVKISAKRSVAFGPARNQLKLGYLSQARDERIIP